MGGIDSPAFKMFEDLFVRGFYALQKHVEGLSAIVQVRSYVRSILFNFYFQFLHFLFLSDFFFRFFFFAIDLLFCLFSGAIFIFSVCSLLLLFFFFFSYFMGTEGVMLQTV